jgi:CDP-diacylglycerol---serine O-phosphatidyltransferase
MPTKRRLSPEERRERRRRAVQRSKFALPSAITLTSVLCGFSSVVMALDAAPNTDPTGHFQLAALLLIAAAVFDVLDGMVARATNTATEFGVQLDSLADVLSFGMAPAILAYRYGFYLLGTADPQLRAIGWAASFFFLACGALRLARFNVQVGTTDHRFFTGMPIPTGAACVASVVLFFPGAPREAWQAYVFATELFLVGLLMVSTIRFPSLKKISAGGHSLIYLLAGFAALLSLLVIFRRHFFLGFFATYTALAFALNLAWLLGWRGIAPPDTGESPPEPEVE